MLLEQEVPILTNYLHGNVPKYMTNHTIREEDRDSSVCRILELCKEKAYRKETYLLAVSIFDRYLAKTYNISTTRREQLPLLFTTSTILAAKLEQPMTPSIRRMIRLLTSDEQ